MKLQLYGVVGLELQSRNHFATEGTEYEQAGIFLMCQIKVHIIYFIYTIYNL